jgi:hypothetical protein
MTLQLDRRFYLNLLDRHNGRRCEVQLPPMPLTIAYAARRAFLVRSCRVKDGALSTRPMIAAANSRLETNNVCLTLRIISDVTVP